MAEYSGNLSAGFGSIDVASETMIFFAQRAQGSADSLKETMDSSRKQSKALKDAEAESRKLKQQLENLLAGVPGAGKPANLEHIKKLLKDVADNTSLSDQQRQNANDILKTLSASKSGDLLHNSLGSDDWKRLTNLASKYAAGTAPITENSRERVMAWISLSAGNKNGEPYIGTPTSHPKASAEDVAFLNQIRGHLNERQKVATTVEWTQINPQIKSLLSAHFEALEPKVEVEDDSVRNVMVQVALQNFNNAINGGSASSKAIHDVKKSITDRI